MAIKVISERELTEIELAKIADIMAVSQCPNESLINSIDGCLGLGVDYISIGNKNNYT